MKQKVSKSSSVEKALEILECFNNKTTHLTLNEISIMTGYPKTVAFRMINSLEKYGYLRKEKKYKETKFTLGWLFLNKAILVKKNLNIRELFGDYLIQLRNNTGLTVQLVIRDGNEAVIVEQIESLNAIQIYSQIGKRLPLYLPSCPRLLLAYLHEEEQNLILENTEFHAITDKTLVDTNLIKTELLKIKELGIAISRGELYEGIIEVASPIFDLERNVIAAISIAGIESHLKKGQLQKCIEEVKLTAKTISSEIQ